MKTLQPMRFLTLLALALISSSLLIAQNKGSGNISGVVADALGRSPLPDATVTILAQEDSAAVGFAVTGKTGVFEIKNLSTGSFILNITYTGYQQYIKNFTISANQLSIPLDTVYLHLDTTAMAGIIVTAPPIVIKQDTVEFRASSFKTKPNATVEDLFKKLPGVDVDKDGKVTAQGEEITRIYVDGKEFFSNDPKLATKNLTADLVESIQVFDDMSDQAKFTRIDDGSRQRTINIKLKKDKKKGMFGRATVGAGSNDRYTANAAFNVFDDDKQISILGGANNINRQGFTSNDMISSMGGMQGFSGGGGRGGGGRGGGTNLGGSAGNGNTNSWSTGINFRDRWGAKVDFSGNYFVSSVNTVNSSRNFRQSFFPEDSLALTSEESYRKNSTLNHRLGFRLEYFIDSMNSILLTPDISFQQSESVSMDSLETYASSPKTINYKAIGGTANRTSERNGLNVNSNLLFRHRFRKPGRTFTIGWNTGYSNSDGEGINESPYRFYNPDSTERRFDNRRQRNDQATNSFNNTISTSITEMIDVNKIFELNYAYSVNKSNSDRNTYDYSDLSGKFDSLNKPLTNYFENLFTSSRLGTNFRVKNKKYDYQLGGAVQFATLENLSNRATTGKDSIMKQQYTNFFPSASFNYNLGARKSLRFNYRGRTRAPGIQQLQDVQDQSNSLRIRTGNPDLKQEFNNTFQFSYNTLNLKNFLFFNLNLNANITGNKIVNSIDKLDTDSAVQLIRPENVDGAQGLSFSGTVGIPLKKVTTGRRSPVNLNLTTTIRYNRDVSKLYKVVNYNYTRSVGERIGFNYNIQDKLDVGANVSLNYNDARYSVQQDLNYKYFNHNYSLDVSYTFFKNFLLNSDFDYFVNSGRADGFNQSIPMWNASLSWLLFKKRNGELKFHVIDLLNQNKSINREVFDNYIEDSYTQVLRRYFLVTFMYNLNRFGGRNAAPAGRNGGFPGNRGGGGNGGNGGGGRRN